tara:strand:+ start:306 stop:590 length:285 start_codon:yes stop_codon:yes gene_type:complete
MSNHIIERDNPNRWFMVQNGGTGEESLILFGNVGTFGETELETGEQYTLSSFLTEDELESEVDSIAGSEDYYKESVETGNKFQYPSEKYINPTL